MASGAGGTPQSLLSLLSLLLLAHAAPNLHPSDHQALLQIKRGLGLNFISSRRPCDSAGVTCERWRIPNNTFFLRITQIVFRSQHLSGILPPAIGKLSELKELSLAGNVISGFIPPEISRCRKLEILELNNNRFSGKIPPEISSLIQLRILDLSSNEFSGNLNFLKQFPNLEKLSLSDNMFSGKVPETLRSFRNLRFFNISNNRLLEGAVPVVNWIEYSSTDSTDGDRILRRYMFAEDSKFKNRASALAPSASQNVDSDIAPAQAPAPTTITTTRKHKHKKHKKDTKKMILGFVVGAVVGVVCGVLLSALYKLIMYLIRGGEMDPAPAIYSPLIKKAEHLAFLEAKDGVASLEVIGRGGCGEVYKAELPGTGGRPVAIKRIAQPLRDATELTEEDSKFLNKFMRQIRSEIQTVGHIRHRNLLPLLAHVARPDCHYLIYEFMKNGSLQDIMNQVSLGTRELDWLSRYKIALGIASGLEYLHVSHSPRIIHRDLKPANILLDDDMEAKIADFGLAKAMPNVDSHVTTSKVAGTVGYIAPEYFQTLKFTDKCDVYSFGVVLGVLVTGKFPSDNFFQTTAEVSLVRWMRNVMTSDDPTIAIDPKLKGNGYDEKMLLVLKIACFCTLEDPKQRPNSKDVRCMLAQIIH